MANYDLDRLGSSEFENLVQALSIKIFDNKSIIFGSGPDGAREATYQGKSTIDNESFDGYHVVQAKFKESLESKDWEWAKNQLKKEMKKFKDKKSDLPTPDIYLFFTNIKFTGVSKTGGRDKIEEFKKEYFELIPNIMVYGCDDIYKMLDGNRDVATSYSSFILPGDILQELYSFIKINNSNEENILYRFLNKEFEEDLYSKLEQAGKVTDEKINLEKVFIDLNISADYLDKEEKFVNFCVKNGNRTWKDKQFKMVFIGGPGQGKSTVTQFLTQIYRVSFLNTFKNKTLLASVEKFEKQIDDNMKPKCYRFPIKIILSDYSEWLYKQKKDDLSYSILSYIQNRIEYRADAKFTTFDNFRVLLEKLSFLFIFDGLDEVPSTSNRSDVVTEIDSFINHELKAVNCDAMIIATTRPQGYSDEFSSKKDFKHFKLNDMDSETCIKYLKGLVKNTINSTDERVKQLKILKDTLNNEITANLMKTPLQATIMAILVKSGGKPSKDKFSLFDDYYQTMLKREKQKNVLEIISEHEDYINEIHYKLRNKLQKSSQNKEYSSALMEKDIFQNLVEEYFEDVGVTQEDKERYTKDIMEAITERLVFITENQDNKIGFAIRSTQEYFSAMMNVHNIQDDKVINNMKNISKSIYWRNVLIFMLGYIAKKKTYLLDNLDSFVGELNGSALNHGEISLSQITRYGSLLSLDILSESIFANRPKEENKFIKHLKELTNVISLNNSTHMLQKLKPTIINSKMIDVLMIGVQSTELPIRMSSWGIIAILSATNHKFIDKFRSYWKTEEQEELYYLNLFSESKVYTEFILEKYYKYLNWDYYDNLKNIIRIEGFIEALSKSNNLNQNITKNFLIENLFLIHKYYPFSKNEDKLFFKLLGINTDSTLDSLKENYAVLAEIGSFNASIIKVKDLRKNQLLIELYNTTKKDKELSLLATFFNYLLNPSSETLKKCFIEMKLKTQINHQINLYSLAFNWQLKYIINEIRNDSSEEIVFKNIDKFGNNFEDIIKYEREFYSLDKIFENGSCIQIQKKDEENSEEIIEFFEEVYLKNKSKFSQELLRKFIFSIREIKNNSQFKQIINEIKTITNTNTNTVIDISLVALMSLVEKKELPNIAKNLNISTETFLHLNGILGNEAVNIVIKNIIDLIRFEEKENSLIILIFNILSKNRRSDYNMYDTNILAKLKYTNKELQIYGYLSALVSKNIYTEKNEMKKITDLLLASTKTHNNIFKNTLDIIMNNNIKGNFVEHLLLEMYKCIDKNSIKNCILASQYENSFKSMFENKVIKFEGA